MDDSDRFSKTCKCGKDIYEAGGSPHQNVCPHCLLEALPATREANHKPPGAPNSRAFGRTNSGRYRKCGDGAQFIRKGKDMS